MPPQIPGPTGSKTTRAQTTNVTNVDTSRPAESNPPVQQQPSRSDPKSTAKATQASRKHATENKSNNDIRGQMAQKQLSKQLSDRKPKEGVWNSVQNAVRVAADIGNAGVEALREGTAEASTNVAKYEFRQRGVEKLAQKQYRQDLVPGEFFEVETIKPGNTNEIQNRERVEDLSRGDVAARRYHPEQHRQATQSGLEDRLKELNQGELTPFEKKLITEWDPQMKGQSPVIGLNPILAIGTKDNKGPTEVQANGVVRGGSGKGEVTYYDRNGNELTGIANRQKAVEKLDQRKHPQDMIPGKMFEVEQIKHGSTNKTETHKNSEYVGTTAPVPVKDHPIEHRQATQSALKDRLIELNGGGPLTDFEQKVVSEWNQRGRPDAIDVLSPIKGLDPTGTKGPVEVLAYKAIRGNQTTYYDRNGNVLMDRWSRNAGQAIPTDGPADYVSAAHLGAKVAIKTGAKIGEKVLAREGRTAAKMETGTIARSADGENATAVRTSDNRAASQTQQPAKESDAPVKHSSTTKKDSPEVQPKVILAGRTDAEREVIRRWREQQTKVDEALDWLDPGELDVVGDALEGAGKLNTAAQKGGKIRQVREALKNSKNLDRDLQNTGDLIGEDLRDEVRKLQELEKDMIAIKTETGRQIRNGSPLGVWTVQDLEERLADLRRNRR